MCKKYIITTLILLFISFSLGKAQGVGSFIIDFKKQYESKVEALSLNKELIYVPAVMNLLEVGDWFNLSINEKRDSLLAFLQKPILANDFAINVNTGRYYSFPEGLLLECRDSVAVNHIIEVSGKYAYRMPSKKLLLEYLRQNSVDYVFTVINLGYYGSNYWMIQDDELFILLFDENLNCLSKIDIDSFLKKSDFFFDNPFEITT